MRFSLKKASVLIFCGFALCWSSAQSQTEEVDSTNSVVAAHEKNAGQRSAPPAFSVDDGLAVIAAALDAHVHVARQRDCSHMVHAIYASAGFPYVYASSSDLYAGADNFQQVTHPQPGDLVVWPGHVGIMVNPAQHIFFSKLHKGPGIDDYDAPYWKQRGDVRFYRYLKDSPVSAAATRPVRYRKSR